MLILFTGDSLRNHVSAKFSTRDQDNDVSIQDCARFYKAGWWFHDCHDSNLNSLYRPRYSKNFGIEWKTFRGLHYSLRFTEMKIRPYSVN